MTLAFHYKLSPDGCLIFLQENGSLRSVENISTHQWPDKFQNFSPEISGRVMAIMDEDSEEFGLEIREDCVFIPNLGVAKLTKLDGDALSMPAPVPFILDIRSSGTIDQSEFKFTATWLNSGIQIPKQRTGAFLLFGNTHYRIPNPLFSIIEQIDEFNTSSFEGDGARFSALARIQETLGENGVTPLQLDKYLGGIRVAHAVSFSLSVPEAVDNEKNLSFSPILFKRRFQANTSDETTEEDALLPSKYQRVFAEDRFLKSPNVRDRYALGDGVYVYLDPDLVGALQVTRHIQESGDIKKQLEFCRNPRAFLIQEMPKLSEDQANTLFVETTEYSSRIQKIAPFSPPVLPWIRKESERWIPESFGISIGNVRIQLNETTLSELIAHIKAAIDTQKEFVLYENAQIPADTNTLKILKGLVVTTKKRAKKKSKGASDESSAPIVLMIEDNFHNSTYKRGKVQRENAPPLSLPPDLKSTLKSHQIEGVSWMQRAWAGGQVGLLLADDMGLGKTLQALCFCVWLRQSAQVDGPVLTVAPTGLLKNWEAEYEAHFRCEVLRDIRLVSGVDMRALREREGAEIVDGRAHLKVDLLQRADWILASYETVRDYQHSFAAIKCSAVVFDEMQKIKSPSSLATYAAKSLNADFVLGMTGTPVENRLADLWCILDAIEPGELVGNLREFSRKYETENENDLRMLKALLTEKRDNFEPIMLRRLKAENLPDLPIVEEYKSRVSMPEQQSQAYENVVAQAQQASGGDVLHAIQQLRGVSLYPSAPEHAGEHPEWSARFQAMFEILDSIHKCGEKVLIFLESRELQPTVAQLIKRHYSMEKQPMLINGSVSGGARQARVEKFQSGAAGFDAIILSPRAAGVGLTLTAANHVIHLSRWWNPAVEDQCSGRAHRIGQKKAVSVYYPMAIHPEYGETSFDLRLDALLERKRTLSADLLMPPAATRQDSRTLLEETLEASSKIEIPDWDEVDAMEPTQFEEFVIQKLIACGWIVRRTPMSGDGGADIIVEKDGSIVFLIQCKHTQNPAHAISDEAIRDLRRALENYSTSAIPIAITNADKFSTAASAAASDIGAKLVCRSNWGNGWEIFLGCDDCLTTSLAPPSK